MGFGFEQAGLGRNVAKLTVAEIGENAIGLLVDRRLEHLDAIVDVRVRSEEVFPAVVIEIEEADAPAAVVSAQRGQAA